MKTPLVSKIDGWIIVTVGSTPPNYRMFSTRFSSFITFNNVIDVLLTGEKNAIQKLLSLRALTPAMYLVHLETCGHDIFLIYLFGPKGAIICGESELIIRYRLTIKIPLDVFVWKL